MTRKGFSGIVNYMKKKVSQKIKMINLNRKWQLILIIILLMTIGPRPDESLYTSAQENQQDEPSESYYVDTNQQGIFPLPMELKDNVEFWKKIYTKYSSDEVIIHDNRYMNIIYTNIDFGYLKDEDISEREKERIRNRKIKEVKENYKRMLLRLSKKDMDINNLNDDEKRIYGLYAKIEDRDKFVMDRRGKRIRAQAGQKEFFIKGLIDSGEYLSEMERVFEEYDLPIELTRLAFVESMFNPYAYSKYGAAGVWQFMKATGKRYLAMNRIIDERLDPLLSTVAAARFLTKNYESLGNWPLAITAYNHGDRGIMKAVEKTNSSHLPEIINNYNSRRFGFASRNFYAEFLAALNVVNNYKAYFGDIPIKPSLRFDVVQLEKGIFVKDIERYCDVTRDEIKRLNPALLKEVIESRLSFPKGFILRVPEGKKEAFQKGLEAFSTKYVARKKKEEKEEADKIKGFFGDSKGVSF